MPYINKFLIGADPEFAALKDRQLINVKRQCGFHKLGPVGYDHNGWVIEIRPEPSLSSYALLQNIRRLLKSALLKLPPLPEAWWKSGAYVRELGEFGNERSLGGHVHFGFPEATLLQGYKIVALNKFAEILVKVGFYYLREIEARRNEGWGGHSDTRPCLDHVEYRTFPSWLFHPKAAFLVTTGAKLVVAEPEIALANLKQSKFKGLRIFFDLFKNKDDDATRLCEQVLNKPLNINEIRASTKKDIRDSWRLR